MTEVHKQESHALQIKNKKCVCIFTSPAVCALTALKLREREKKKVLQKYVESAEMT